MTTSPENADSALAAEVQVDGPVDITRASRPATELLVELEMNLIARPDDWKLLVLETVGQWPESSEVIDDQPLSYLLGGEAFDWRLLARRILETTELAVSFVEIPHEGKQILLIADEGVTLTVSTLLRGLHD